MSDGSGSASWTYDSRGRLIQESKAVTGAGNFLTQWGYNSADLPLWMKYPGDNAGQVGEQVNYTYHPQMLLNSLSGSSTYVTSTQYDASGRVELRTYLPGGGGGPGLHTDYQYYLWDTANGQGRLQRLQSGSSGNPASLQNLEYNYDAVGNINWIKDYLAGGPQTQSFTYDSLDRLTSASASGGAYGNYAESYSYDPASGNLSAKTGMGAYTYDTLHKHAVASTTAGWSYQYDANGNMTRRDPPDSAYYDFAYDAENRLTSVSGSAVATFVYDGDGRRVKATVGGVTTTYPSTSLRAGVGNFFEWTGSTSTMVKYYSAGATRGAMRVGSSTLYYLLGDHLGSTSVSYNAGTSQTVTQLYKPWGEVRYSSGGLPTKYIFTGQLSHVSDFGLLFYQARWYDHCPVDVVYDFFSRLSNRLKYNPQLSAIRQTPDGPLRIGTQITEVRRLLGMTREMVKEVSELEPSGTIGYRTCMGDPIKAFGAYRFEAVPEGTRLTLNFTLAPQWMMRLVVPLMAGGFKRSIASGLWNIKAVLGNQSHHPPHAL